MVHNSSFSLHKGNHQCTKSQEEWTKLLKQSRSAREELKSSTERPDWNQFVATFSLHLEAIAQEIAAYYLFASRRGGAHSETTEAESKSIDRKARTAATRNALRFGISCLSVEDEEARKQIQQEMVSKWHCHESACRLLMLTPDNSDNIASGPNHTKIRLFAARLLCNMVSQNEATSAILLSTVAGEPNPDELESRVTQNLQGVLFDCDSNESCIGNEKLPNELNGLDILISSTASGCRDAFAAVVATIYNALMALHQNRQSSGTETDGLSSSPFLLQSVENFVQNGLFVSHLLRHIVSSSACEAFRGGAQTETNSEVGDDATSWISHLFMLFLRNGSFPMAYRSIGSLAAALPEQVTLLYCVRKELENVVNKNASSASIELFGQQNIALNFISFLLEVYSECRSPCALAENENERDEDEPTMLLRKSAMLAITDTIGSYLGVDDFTTKKIREHLGTNLSVEQFLLDLAQVYDSIAQRKEKSSSDEREFTLSKDEEKRLISLVRLVGHLSFQCRSVQDLIRTTSAPLNHRNEPPKERFAIHVILSTSSLSYTCFTLREWCLVAIRYLLENNDSNQRLLSELQAQQPCQSSELESMGLRLEMTSKGDLGVRPLS